jgi:hypothetical protein
MARQTRAAEALAPATEAQISQAPMPESAPASHERRSKLSVNVNYDISERLRNLAYTHRLSESSIVEIALAMVRSPSHLGMRVELLEPNAGIG